MKTKVILLSNVEGIGGKGQVVDVAEGFARNYLIPRHLAQLATSTALKNLSFNLDLADKRSAKSRARADEIKSLIESKIITISAKAGPTGTLFGAVTSDMISRSLKREFNVVMDRKSIDILDPIKNIGAHLIKIKLHHDVTADLKLEITKLDK